MVYGLGTRAEGLEEYRNLIVKSSKYAYLNILVFGTMQLDIE